jgi:hypothetical protein
MEVNANINAKQILCYICYAEVGRYIKQNGLQAAATDVGLVLPALPNPEYQNWKSGGFVFVIDSKKLGQAFQGFCRFLTADVHGTTVDGMPDLTWDVHIHEFTIPTREEVNLYHGL